MTELWCPTCHAPLQPGTSPPVRRCTSCQRSFPERDGYVDLLGTPSVDDEFDWDPLLDPRISAATTGRWRSLVRANRAALVPTAGRARVVNVGGAGDDWFGPACADLLERYVVLDPSVAQLRRFRPPVSGTTLVRGVGEQLPLPDEWADAVWLHGVLDHLPEVAPVLAEAHRTAATGAVVVVSLTNDGSWFRTLAARVGVHPDDGHVHERRLDLDDLARTVTDAGFVVEHRETLGYLRLPRALERLVFARVPDRVVDRILDVTDRLGRRVLGPGRGAISIVVGRRV